MLTAQTGEVVTPAQLLGEEGNDLAAKTTEAEASMKALEKRMSKAGVR